MIIVTMQYIRKLLAIQTPKKLTSCRERERERERERVKENVCACVCVFYSWGELHYYPNRPLMCLFCNQVCVCVWIVCV